MEDFWKEWVWEDSHDTIVSWVKRVKVITEKGHTLLEVKD